MTDSAVLLYGPPGGGKDTVTDALTRRNRVYRLGRRLKAGPGRTRGYRMTTIEIIDALTATDQVLWRNDRYGATYATDRLYVDRMLRAGLIPVLHVGQSEAIDAITNAAPGIAWTVVELWCPRVVAVERVTARGTGDIDQRMAAYDCTPRLRAPDLRFSTTGISPDEIAARIDRSVRSEQKN